MKRYGILFLLLLWPALALAAPSADEIVARANKAAYYAGKDGQADVKMTIYDAHGGTRQREFSILRLNVAGEDQKFYVYFKKPSDVRKMAFLVWKHVGGDDDRWLWLPALNLKKRIAPGDKRTSFVGSDFFYEDVSGRGLEEDVHQLVKETDDQWLIKNTPKDPDSVEFSWYQVWIDKATSLPVKAEYFDKEGKLYRRVSAEKIETIQGHPTVVEAVAEDLLAGTRTVNRFSKVKYDIGLKERLFTERFLRRPPREVTR
ncbi:outer membrane lipoprotein-sorting protein [Geothermobacter hydrogeniphilus]|uniref:Outer membrane lipoprotein-sorting protein n=1 Tax=Geothermobacter hydrogeniphilus TaxID=1969733 RepID=A0A2K2HB17_9BACT|nr:outer membrane lipoprotein-sorting protein [Geothermobacter hydrogeniphilus]PNU20461.1 outer membrane lipoprotein-sorting protein [Geothermobacter hydrogeniphilus]